MKCTGCRCPAPARGRVCACCGARPPLDPCMVCGLRDEVAPNFLLLTSRGVVHRDCREATTKEGG